MAKRLIPNPEFHEQVAEWVRRTTAEQGVPEKVTDPATIKKVAVLLGVRPVARDAAAVEGHDAGDVAPAGVHDLDAEAGVVLSGADAHPPEDDRTDDACGPEEDRR